MLTDVYNWFLYPHRIAAVRPWLKSARPRLLDIGCGNHSPRITKTYLPQCEYHGVDNRRWNRDAEDDRLRILTSGREGTVTVIDVEQR